MSDQNQHLPQSSLPILRKGLHEETTNVTNSANHSVSMMQQHSHDLLQSTSALVGGHVNKTGHQSAGNKQGGNVGIAVAPTIAQQVDSGSVVSEEAKAELHNKKLKHREKFLYRLNV
jgi:hypothetical protein